MKLKLKLKHIIIYLFVILTFVILFHYYRKRFQTEQYNNPMLNIYNQPLQPCKEQNMSNGSWDSEGKCSERGGGVHQICIKNIAQNTKGFSKNTGQSNWSDMRGNNNHCVCLGAWSLFNKQKNQPNQDKKILKCDAIPKISLSTDYVSKFSEGWNKWNGLEIDDQIKEGVESLYNQCYDKTDSKSEELKKNYCDFAMKVPILKSSKLFKSNC